MKYLSVIILFSIVYWSWGMTKSHVSISEETHVSLQEDLKKLITNYINENLPNSKNLKFERMWTERIKEDQIKATFNYSFEDPGEDIAPARVQIDGYAILNKKLEPNKEIEVWNFDELSILNNHIEFKESDTITVQPETNR